MRELHLVHTIRIGREPNVGVLKEGPNTWERLDNGDFVVKSTSAPDEEFVIPGSNVKLEKRPRQVASPTAPAGGNTKK